MTEGPPAWELLLETPWLMLGIVAHVCNPSIQKAEAGLPQLCSWLGLHSEPSL